MELITGATNNWRDQLVRGMRRMSDITLSTRHLCQLSTMVLMHMSALPVTWATIAGAGSAFCGLLAYQLDPCSVPSPPLQTVNCVLVYIVCRHLEYIAHRMKFSPYL